MLDYTSENAYSMDDDSEATTNADAAPAATGHWMAMSTYEIYMVDTRITMMTLPGRIAANPVMSHRQCSRSKARRSHASNMDSAENGTANNTDDLAGAAANEHHQDDPAGQEDPFNPENPDDSEDSNYLPLSEEEASLGDDDFIVPEDPLEQERFKRRLLATARSLKKQKRKIKAEQDTLNDRWTKVLAAEVGYGRDQPTSSYPK